MQLPPGHGFAYYKWSWIFRIDRIKQSLADKDLIINILYILSIHVN